MVGEGMSLAKSLWRKAPWIMLSLLVAMGFLWAVCYAVAPRGAQGLLFSDAWSNAFGDFFLNCREWVASEHYVGDARVPTHELVYPLIAYWPMSLFPDTMMGAGCFSAFGALCLAAGLLVFVRSRMKSAGVLWQFVGVLACLCSFHVIFAFERANVIYISAACVCIFLAWYNSASCAKRVCAAAALAVAGATKIMPGAFGLLYFVPWFDLAGEASERRRLDWVSIFLCGLLAVALLFVPYWVHGRGGGDLRAFLENVAENSKIYGGKSAWGIVAFWRELLFAGVQGLSGGLGMARAGNMLVGLLLLWMATVVGHRRLRDSERLLLLTVAIMLMPANSCTYMALYLLPGMLLSVGEMMDRPLRLIDGVTLGIWLIVFMPFQIPLSWFVDVQGVPLNYALANFGLFLLVVITMASVLKRGPGRIEK